MSEEYLTVAEAARKLSVSSRTIQRYCKQGRLNFKWITGKRHKELRIVPPISIIDLPGVRHKSAVMSDNFVTKGDFETFTQNFETQLKDKELRILELELEIAEIKSDHSGSKQNISKSLLHDLEKVRPAEKKLILKIAREVKKHDDILRKLAIATAEKNPPDSE